MDNYIHLTYFGHSCFKLKTPLAGGVLIDPYKNQLSHLHYWFKISLPKIECNSIIISHNNFDHNAIEKVNGYRNVFDKSGGYYISNYVIRMLEGEHARPAEHMCKNLISLIDVVEVRFAHWGDNNFVDSDKLKSLGRVNILMLPIDESEHLLTIDQVEETINHIKPRVIIPMHYYIEGLHTYFSGLKTIDNWLNKQSEKIFIKRISSNGAIISRGSLPRQQEIWVFEPSRGENERGKD